MKDLEFRFFLKENKKIYKVSMLSFPFGNEGLKDVCIYIPEEDCYQWFGIEEGNLMMFTGLRDKNGTKIFEGDIVKSSFLNYKIVFDRYGWDSGYGFTGFIGIANYEKKDYYDFYEANRDIYDDEIEVVGNIYENPELFNRGE